MRSSNTKKVNTTAYHPQTDGIVERFNRTLCQSISMYVSRDQKDWDKHLAAILFGYRVSPHDTTGESPLFLLYGREPGLLVDVSLLPPRDESNSVPEHRARVVQTLEDVHAIARENIQRAQQRVKDVYDRSARDPKFTIGEKVWVYTPKTKKGLSRELMHHWHGPFRIVEKCSPVHYKLRTCDNRLVSITVHANRMKPYYSPDLQPRMKTRQSILIRLSQQRNYLTIALLTTIPYQHPNDSRHEPAVSDTPHSADTLYNIEQVLKQQTRKGKKQFLVKWEGYGHQHTSWVDETNVVQTNANEHYYYYYYYLIEHFLVTWKVKLQRFLQ